MIVNVAPMRMDTEAINIDIVGLSLNYLDLSKVTLM